VIFIVEEIDESYCYSDSDEYSQYMPQQAVKQIMTNDSVYKHKFDLEISENS
jgi:hypothetical protein